MITEFGEGNQVQLVLNILSQMIFEIKVRPFLG